jgi:uncharacterized UBP type Zn finger protein
MAPICQHLSSVTESDFSPPVPPDSCADCLVEGTVWVHLRQCGSCGHVGCCDSSPRRHASKHYLATRHPVVRSIEPGETWAWCYVDEMIADPAVPD